MVMLSDSPHSYGMDGTRQSGWIPALPLVTTTFYSLRLCMCMSIYTDTYAYTEDF